MGTTAFIGRGLLLASGLLYVSWTPELRAEQALTLPQAIQYSLQHNGELNSQRQEGKIGEAARLKASLLPNPTLELEGSTGALTGSSAESTLSLGISQEFFLTGQREKRLAVAERQLAVQRWQLAERERNLTLEVKSAFGEFLLAQQRLALADRTIALGRQLLDVAGERLTAGDIPELELNLVKVELARSEGARLEALTTLAQKQAQLGALMGLPPGPYPPLTGTLEIGGRVTAPLADLKRLARERRPDLKALEEEQRKGEAELVLARAEAIPNLTAGLSFARETTSIEVGGVEGRETAYTIGLKLSLPIPLFDRNQAGLQEARARSGSVASRAAALAAGVEREVETAHAALANAERVLDLYRSGILPQFEENLKLTQEAYRLGEVGILNVIQEQKKFFELNDSYLAALHGRQAALMKLETATATDLSGGAQ